MLEFVRYGGHAPQFLYGFTKFLEQTYRSKKQPNLFFAGQMTVVKAMLSQQSGLVAGTTQPALYAKVKLSSRDHFSARKRNPRLLCLVVI